VPVRRNPQINGCHRGATGTVKGEAAEILKDALALPTEVPAATARRSCSNW